MFWPGWAEKATPNPSRIEVVRARAKPATEALRGCLQTLSILSANSSQGSKWTGRHGTHAPPRIGLWHTWRPTPDVQGLGGVLAEIFLGAEDVSILVGLWTIASH